MSLDYGCCLIYRRSLSILRFNAVQASSILVSRFPFGEDFSQPLVGLTSVMQPSRTQARSRDPLLAYLAHHKARGTWTLSPRSCLVLLRTRLLLATNQSQDEGTLLVALICSTRQGTIPLSVGKAAIQSLAKYAYVSADHRILAN